MDFLSNFYSEWMVTKDLSTFFSPQTFIANLYLIALFVSMYKASKKRELFTNFITIISVCVQYMFCAILIELSIYYAKSGGNIALAQAAYLGLIAIALLAFNVSYKAHQKWAFVFGQLFIVANKLIALMCVGHLVIWFKLAVFKVYSVTWVDVFYSSYVLFISAVLAVIMIFPSFLKTRLGKFVTFSFR